MLHSVISDIEKSYAGRLEEAEKLPDEETIIKTNSELHEKRRTSRKPTIAAPPTFVSEDDKSTEVSVADSIPSLSVNESVQTETLSKKPRKGESSRHFEEYTNVGDDEFSDSSDDEKEHMPKRVKPLPAPGIFSPVKPLNKVTFHSAILTSLLQANHVSRAEEATVGNQNKVWSILRRIWPLPNSDHFVDRSRRKCDGGPTSHYSSSSLNLG